MHNTTRHAVDSPRLTRPRTLSLATAGWVVAGIGFFVAFVAVAVMGQGATRYEEFASGVHRGALLVMLGGMLLAFIGHRIHWLRARNRGTAESVDPSFTFERQPFDPPYVDAQIVDSTVIEAELVDTQLVDSRVQDDQHVAFRASQLVAPTILQAERDALARPDLTDQVSVREMSLAGLYAFGLTVAVVVSALMLVFLGSDYSPHTSVTPTVLMLLAHLITAGCARGYLRAFAWGALVPTMVTLCAVPTLLDRPMSNTFAMNADAAWATSVGLNLLYWIAAVPSGFAATGIMALHRHARSARANSDKPTATA